MAFVKICGVKTPDVLDAALDAGADMIGLVFFERSPRHLDLESAAALRQKMTGGAKSVALTVDADDATLDRIVAKLAPDILQLHGTETPDRVAFVKARYGLPVLKAVGLDAREDVDVLSHFAGVSDGLVLDAKPAKGTRLPGGNGQVFDWSILAGIDRNIPFLLSGGLDVLNVAKAIEMTQPAGVDVSSGVETRPGVKDPERVRAFIKTARAAFRDIAKVNA